MVSQYSREVLLLFFPQKHHSVWGGCASQGQTLRQEEWHFLGRDSSLILGIYVLSPRLIISECLEYTTIFSPLNLTLSFQLELMITVRTEGTGFTSLE